MSIFQESDIYFCRVGDRLVFLDVAADRYFCLNPATEAAFVRATEQPSEVARGVPHDGLATNWLADRAPIACVATPLPGKSVFDESLKSLGMTPLAVALCDLATSRARLRLLGMRRTLAWIRHLKTRVADHVDGALPERLFETMAAFAAANGIVTSLDNCLSQSIAIAARLLKRSISVELVVGVRLGPFNAHCWVQRDDWLVNDRMDTVRMFTPILVI